MNWFKKLVTNTVFTKDSNKNSTRKLLGDSIWDSSTDGVGILGNSVCSFVSKLVYDIIHSSIVTSNKYFLYITEVNKKQKKLILKELIK